MRVRLGAMGEANLSLCYDGSRNSDIDGLFGKLTGPSPSLVNLSLGLGWLTLGQVVARAKGHQQLVPVLMRDGRGLGRYVESLEDLTGVVDAEPRVLAIGLPIAPTVDVSSRAPTVDVSSCGTNR